MMKKKLWRGLCLLALFLASGAAYAVNCSDEALKSLVVEDAQFRFVKGRDRNYADFIGIIRNTGKEKVEGIYLVTRYLDAEQRLIDVQRHYDLYDLTLAPGETVPFRFREETSQPESAYVSHQTQIVGAECEYKASACAKPASESAASPSSREPAAQPTRQWGRWLLSILTNFIVPLLLIAVLFVVTRKYSGAKSPVVQVQERQIELIGQQTALLERIAQALEERNKK